MKYSSTPYEKSGKKIPGNSSNFSNSNTSKSSFGIESPVSSMSHGSEAVKCGGLCSKGSPNLVGSSSQPSIKGSRKEVTLKHPEEVSLIKVCHD